MADVQPHGSKDSANLLVGLIAMAGLLAAAWLGQALAHTTTTGPLWRGGASQKTIAVSRKPGRASAGAPAAASKPEVALTLPPPQIYQPLTPQAAAALNAQIAVSTLPNPPAAAFKLDAADALDRARALDCLTMAVYYEAASEPDEGQAAVAQVVLNRLRHPLFPKSVCGVVLQGADLATGCQFTFTCDGSLARRPSEAGWKRARRVAERALDGYVLKSVGEATHYHTVWVAPYWQSTVVKLTRIGAHIFYRWPGGMGRPAAFNARYAGLEPAPPPLPGLTQNPTPVLVAVKAITPPVKVESPVVAAPPQTPIAPAAVTPPAVLVAQLQSATEPQSYFGRPRHTAQRLPVGNGW